MTAVLNKIKTNGEISIPGKLLKKIGLMPGAEIVIHIEKNSLVIEKPHSSISHLREKFKNIDIETPIRNLRKRWNLWNRKTSA